MKKIQLLNNKTVIIGMGRKRIQKFMLKHFWESCNLQKKYEKSSMIRGFLQCHIGWSLIVIIYFLFSLKLWLKDVVKHVVKLVLQLWISIIHSWYYARSVTIKLTLTLLQKSTSWIQLRYVWFYAFIFHNIMKFVYCG